MSEERRQRILVALRSELDRQAGEERPGRPRLADRSDRSLSVVGEVDLVALATAIDAALGADARPAATTAAGDLPGGPQGAGASPKGAYATVDEGRTPDQLNASNDE